MIHQTNDANTFRYTDYDIRLGSGEYIYYYVKKNGSTNHSNIVDTRGYFYKESVKNSKTVAYNFTLSQNQPNPFNPTTTIKYSIPNVGTPQFAHVQLKVYDVLGRKAAVLVNENMPPGNYEVEFNASNLASGIYFYRLQAEGYTLTRKMMLIK